MAFDDRAADGEADTHSTGLGRVECAEQPIHGARIEPDADILYGERHAILAQFGPNHQLATTILDGIHRLDGIHDEIEDHLLELHAITIYRGQRRREGRA